MRTTHSRIERLFCCLALLAGLTTATQPSLLFIVLDEYRGVPVYPSWEAKHLPHLNSLRAQGIFWDQHRVVTTACAPSRASIFTGHFPSVTGVTQTDGVAKVATDPGMFWLDPATTPTLGHWLEASGIPAYYVGKWHLNQADILDATTHLPVPSYNATTGVPDPALEHLYRHQQRLAPFGFRDWVGPDPHGRSPLDTGVSSSTTPRHGRDATYTRQVVDLLFKEKGPLAVVWSPVGTHDIATYGSATSRMDGFSFPVEETIPRPVPAPSSANETLWDKPSTQAAYRDLYPIAFQPIDDPEEARAVYLSLMAQVDRELGEVLEALRESPRANSTWIVLTSDHGELLGSHGLWQKWHSAYEEILRVPLVWVPPVNQAHKFAPGGTRVTDALTSHVDLLPTLVDLFDLSPPPQRFLTPARNLPGQNRLDLLVDTFRLGEGQDFSLFVTSDDPTRGETPVDWSGTRTYAPVEGPTVLSAVVGRVQGCLYKLVRYQARPGEMSTGEEYELYNLTVDPTEEDNLAGDPDFFGVAEQLEGLLL